MSNMNLVCYVGLLVLSIGALYVHRNSKYVIETFEMYYDHSLKDADKLLKYFNKHKHPHNENDKLNAKNHKTMNDEMKYLEDNLLT